MGGRQRGSQKNPLKGWFTRHLLVLLVAMLLPQGHWDEGLFEPSDWPTIMFAFEQSSFLVGFDHQQERSKLPHT